MSYKTLYTAALARARKVGSAHADPDSCIAELASILAFGRLRGLPAWGIYGAITAAKLTHVQAAKLPPLDIEELFWQHDIISNP